MPYSAPARLDSEQALNEMLASLFRRLQAEPAPEGLIALIDQLEAACQSRAGSEARSIG